MTFHECDIDIVSPRDAIDLMLACRRDNTERLLIDADRLPPEFFDLSTGFAGEFLQKFVNYGITVAIVFGERVYSDAFTEFVAEARRGREMRAFHTRDEAEAWLDG